MSDCVPFHRAYYIHGSGVPTGLSCWRMVGPTWNCCRLGASSVCTIQPCATLKCYFIQSRIGSVQYASLAVTYHLHFWQNDWDLLRAAAVTRGWNGYRNKSRYSKFTLEKNIPRRSCLDSNPGPFDQEQPKVHHKPTQTSHQLFNNIQFNQLFLSCSPKKIMRACVRARARV